MDLHESEDAGRRDHEEDPAGDELRRRLGRLEERSDASERTEAGKRHCRYRCCALECDLGQRAAHQPPVTATVSSFLVGPPLEGEPQTPAKQVPWWDECSPDLARQQEPVVPMAPMCILVREHNPELSVIEEFDEPTKNHDKAACRRVRRRC